MTGVVIFLAVGFVLVLFGLNALHKHDARVARDQREADEWQSLPRPKSWEELKREREGRP
jgi:hypothetical protein